MTKLWDGRFNEPTDRIVEAFTSSIDVDRKLYAHDIEGSIAHCRTLERAGILTGEEADTLVEGLNRVRKEIEQGRFTFDDRLEDIHMHVESRLFELVGAVARKLHTGRSRNDQIALDIRLYLREQTGFVLDGLLRLAEALVDTAKRHLDVVMPGYTHLQRAQPVLLSHHLMAYFEMFRRDALRFEDGLRRIDVMPLGTAALAGTTYPIDRGYTAELLGFSEVSANSIDTVSDRDFIIEFLAHASLCMLHFSRLSEELVLWSSAEFGFVELPDAFATGSSIMPQKKNPDVPELTRGKTGRVVGALVALLTTMKGLPLSYNRDMQEDKVPLFDAVDTLRICIEVYVRMLPRLQFRKDVMRRSAGRGYLNATDLADYLVGKGMPFREAHECVGRAVAYALEKGRELDELELDELREFSSLIGKDVFGALTVERMIDRRISAGGTAPDQVKTALQRAEDLITEERKRRQPQGKQ